MRELDIGKILADPGDHFAPQARAFQHIRLVDGKHSASPGSRQFKCDAGDALDLGLPVAHGIERLARAKGALN